MTIIVLGVVELLLSYLVRKSLPVDEFPQSGSFALDSRMDTIQLTRANTRRGKTTIGKTEELL